MAEDCDPSGQGSIVDLALPHSYPISWLTHSFTRCHSPSTTKDYLYDITSKRDRRQIGLVKDVSEAHFLLRLAQEILQLSTMQLLHHLSSVGFTSL